VAEYQKPSTWRALWQIVDTIVPYVALWCLIYWSLSVSWWITIPLAALSGGFLIRIFIIFHDCGHGSFFKSQLANDVVGFVTGVLTFTPYYHWTWEHSVHHTNSGDLDRRGTGDIWTMTVQEYLESSRWKKFAYRLARNPFVLFVIAPNFVFLIRQRFPTPGAKERERASVQWMNLAILVKVVALSWIFGLKAYLIIQLIEMGFGGAIGVWLFYVQHQFEGAYWERNEEWDYTAAALQGSSFYKLPKILQWFSGSIGFHHIHHLSPRIPNYNLERCHKADPFFQAVPAVTLFASFKALTFRLWDEPMKQLVGFGRIRELKREMKERAASLLDESGLGSASVTSPIDGRVPSRVDSRSRSN
jgi:omega-6 fatty acid desaturase (delta-12 desaturase)